MMRINYDDPFTFLWVFGSPIEELESFDNTDSPTQCYSFLMNILADPYPKFDVVGSLFKKLTYAYAKAGDYEKAVYFFGRDKEFYKRGNSFTKEGLEAFNILLSDVMDRVRRRNAS